jgi:hypothetical protein
MVSRKRPTLEAFEPVHRTLIQALRASEHEAARIDRELNEAARRVETLMGQRDAAHEAVAAHRKAITAGKWSAPEGFDQFGDAIPASEPIEPTADA